MKKILNELNETIKKKEAQILEHLKAEQQRKRKIGDLESENEELEKGAYELREQLDQIKEGAIAAIVEKDSIITDLQQKIMGLQNNDESNIENTIIQLQEKYRDLQ